MTQYNPYIRVAPSLRTHSSVLTDFPWLTNITVDEAHANTGIERYQTILSEFEQRFAYDEKMTPRTLRSVLAYDRGDAQGSSLTQDAAIRLMNMADDDYMCNTFCAYRVLDVMAFVAQPSLSCASITANREPVGKIERKYWEKMEDWPQILVDFASLNEGASVALPADPSNPLTPRVFKHLNNLSLLFSKKSVVKLAINFQLAALHLSCILEGSTLTDGDIRPPELGKATFETFKDLAISHQPLLTFMKKVTIHKLQMPLHLALFISPLYLLMTKSLHEVQWDRTELLLLSKAIGRGKPDILLRIERMIWDLLFRVAMGAMNVSVALDHLKTNLPWEEIHRIHQSLHPERTWFPRSDENCTIEQGAMADMRHAARVRLCTLQDPKPLLIAEPQPAGSQLVDRHEDQDQENSSMLPPTSLSKETLPPVTEPQPSDSQPIDEWNLEGPSMHSPTTALSSRPIAASQLEDPHSINEHRAQDRESAKSIPPPPPVSEPQNRDPQLIDEREHRHQEGPSMHSPPTSLSKKPHDPQLTNGHEDQDRGSERSISPPLPAAEPQNKDPQEERLDPQQDEEQNGDYNRLNTEQDKENNEDTTDDADKDGEGENDLEPEENEDEMDVADVRARGTEEEEDKEHLGAGDDLDDADDSFSPLTNAESEASEDEQEPPARPAKRQRFSTHAIHDEEEYSDTAGTRWNPIDVEMFFSKEPKPTLNPEPAVPLVQSAFVLQGFTAKGAPVEFSPKLHIAEHAEFLKEFVVAVEDSYVDGKPLHIADPEKSRIIVMTEGNFKKEVAEAPAKLMERIRRKAMVITDSNNERLLFNVAGLSKLAPLSQVVTLQDQSIDPDIDYSTRCVKGTLGDMLKAKLSGDRILNALDFPLERQGVNSPPFATDATALHLTKLRPGYREANNPFSSLAWGICGNRGALHFTHLDAEGFGTIIAPSCGEKLWFLAFPREDNVSFGSIQLYLGDHYEVERPCHELWRWEAVVLQPGDQLVMPPNTPHTVFTISDSICFGGHFYATSTMQHTLFGIVHHFIGGQLLTNTEHPPARSLLRRMMCFYYDALVSGRLQDEEYDAGHIPAFDTFESVLDLLSLCNLIILMNALDPLTYLCLGQDRDHPIDASPMDKSRMQVYDLNSLSEEDRRSCCYARGQCFAVLEWFSLNFQLVRRSSHLEVEFVKDVFRSHLINQICAIAAYKIDAEKHLVQGAPCCTSNLLLDQLSKVNRHPMIDFDIKKQGFSSAIALEWQGPRDFDLIRREEPLRKQEVDEASFLDTGSTFADLQYQEGLSANWVIPTSKCEDSKARLIRKRRRS